ncbi:hypothetical protein B0H14DRAFT_3166843 [Mycena olivaceomarginata]|nr:hypothetical protein B0H14DRAFT_3166843 [Mycena olivaceomarginata]
MGVVLLPFNTIAAGLQQTQIGLIQSSTRTGDDGPSAGEQGSLRNVMAVRIYLGCHMQQKVRIRACTKQPQNHHYNNLFLQRYFNKAVQQHASTTQLPTTIPLALGMGRVIWVGYKVAGSLDRGHQGRVCRHYKRPASDPTHYDSTSVNIGVKAKRSNTLQIYRSEGKAASATASWFSKRTPLVL